MAVPPLSPATMVSNQPDNPNPNPDPNKTDPLPTSTPPPPPSSTLAPVTANPTLNFGIVTEKAYHEAFEELASMIEERTRPLPLPPPPPPVQSATDITGNSKLELPSRDGDSDMDMLKNDTTSENKPVNDHDRPETGSPNRSRRYDRGRSREQDLKREKEREFEKLEREAPRENKERVKEWSGEREKERQRQAEKERGKERELKRKKEIKDDDDSRKRQKRLCTSVLEEKRPLVPIDYSNEKLQAVQPSNAGGTPPNLAAAAEFAKRISNVNPKEEKPDAERERRRRSYDKSSQRDRDQSYEDNNRHRDENREKNIDRGPDKLNTPDNKKLLDAERGRSRRSYDKSSQRDIDRRYEDNNRHRDENREKNIDQESDRERGPDKLKTPDNKKPLDSKQLIDMIPNATEEVFSYEINWAVFDKHKLVEKMRKWISEKVREYLKEDKHSLVEYIISLIRTHVKASKMLEELQEILEDKAERFVLVMWRAIIFEIRKVETGLALR